MDRNALSFAAMPHDRILEVFDQLHTALDSWQHLSTVAEDGYDGGSPETGVTFLTDIVMPRAEANSTIDLSATKPVIPLTDECDDDKLELDEFEDPSEQLAYELGLDPLLLAHHSGLVGSDYRGTLARLKFALSHSVIRPHGGSCEPNHAKLTESAALKQRKAVLRPIYDVPMPQSPHLMQVMPVSNSSELLLMPDTDA